MRGDAEEDRDQLSVAQPELGDRLRIEEHCVPPHPGYPVFAATDRSSRRYYPYWEEPFESYPEPAENVTSPAVLVLESRDCRPPAPVPEPPKLIEVPQTKEAGATLKPESPTLFVFANGERLETRRYMLTADSLNVEIGRQQRTIWIGEVDLYATITANRERGIDLQIPTERNPILLGF